MLFRSVLLSHPYKELKNHLKNVGEACRKEILHKELNITVIKKEILSDLAYLTAICHDFGKGTCSFQDYIKSIRDDKKNIKKADQHAAVS